MSATYVVVSSAYTAHVVNTVWQIIHEKQWAPGWTIGDIWLYTASVGG